MDTKLLARVGAIAFVAIAITVTVIEVRSPRPIAPPAAPAMVAEPIIDPLRAELLRCQSIGEAGANDARCLQAWADNRRRFLGPGSPAAASSFPTAAGEAAARAAAGSAAESSEFMIEGAQ